MHRAVHAHGEAARAEHERVLHGVERVEVLAALDVKVEVGLEVGAKGDVAHVRVDQDCELPPLLKEIAQLRARVSFWGAG